MIIALNSHEASFLRSLVVREMEGGKQDLPEAVLSNLDKKLSEGDLQLAREAIRQAMEGVVGHQLDEQMATTLEALAFGSAVLARAGKNGTPTSTR